MNTFSPAKFRLMRSFLGITAQDVADAMGVQIRTAHRWDSTHTPPADACEWLQSKWDSARGRVEDALDGIEDMAAGRGEPEALNLSIYRTARSTRAAGLTATPAEHMAVNAMIAFESGLDFTVDFVPEEH